MYQRQVFVEWTLFDCYFSQQTLAQADTKVQIRKQDSPSLTFENTRPN